jgi:predicted transcriptional regulator
LNEIVNCALNYLISDRELNKSSTFLLHNALKSPSISLKLEMTNRNLTEITIHILEVVKGYSDNEGLSLTNIMNKLSLSHEQTKEDLMLPLDDDLLSYDSTMRTFKTIEKGLTFLQSYNKIDQALKQQEIPAQEKEKD